MLRGFTQTLKCFPKRSWTQNIPSAWTWCINDPKRTLYSSKSLGIDSYVETREKVNAQFLQTQTRFREKMKEFMEDKPSNMIFTDDLKNMVHLAEEGDLDLVLQMIRKFNSQNKELKFGNFIFGPVVMRMFYHLKATDNALEAFKDPALVGFFDQLISFQLLMDLLYEDQRYKDVLDVYEIVKTRQIQGGKYPKHVICLAFAACYKLNSKVSYDYALKLWHELNGAGHMPMRKVLTFAAGLALNQDAPHVALEILTNTRDQHYLTVRNIKTMAFAAMGRPEDAFPILRSVLEIDDPINKKRTFIKEAVESVRNALEEPTKKEYEAEFNKISKFLHDHGHITDQTLDDILCTAIESTAYSAQKRDRTIIAASFAKNNTGQRVRRDNRPMRAGLQELQ